MLFISNTFLILARDRPVRAQHGLQQLGEIPVDHICGAGSQKLSSLGVVFLAGGSSGGRTRGAKYFSLQSLTV
jgi:hypothetical protein